MVDNATPPEWQELRERLALEAPVEALDLHTAKDVWAVRSASSTVYYLDLDRGLLLRARGAGSAAFAFDDQWVPLVGVTSRDESMRPVRTGEIRVGERPEYLTDPDGGLADYQWRIQRVVTAIEPVGAEEAASLGVPAADGEDRDGRR